MRNTKYYKIKRGCCIEINITLCIQHLEARIRQGWGLLQDNGADNQQCYDCTIESLPVHNTGSQKVPQG